MLGVSEICIRSLEERDLAAVRAFTDREIGQDYYSLEELRDMWQRSAKNGQMCSLVLEGPAGIEGIRISYPPGQWSHGKGTALFKSKWPYAPSDTAYFQSLFLSSQLQGQGWGGRLSQAAIVRLKAAGAKGIVAHSWKESPANSSSRYLLKLGFVELGSHPLYWQKLDYQCTRCGKPPCQCTAVEMYLDLEKL